MSVLFILLGLITVFAIAEILVFAVRMEIYQSRRWWP